MCGSVAKNPVGRFLVLFLSLSLTLPTPTFALRQTGLEESDSTKKELVAALAKDNPSSAIVASPVPSAGLEQKITRREALKTIGAAAAGVGLVLFPAEPVSQPRPIDQTQIDQLLASLPLEQKVALFQSMGWIGVTPLKDERARHLLLNEQVGSFTLYDYNLGTAPETAKMVAEIMAEAKKQGKRMPIFNIDGEGGRLYTNVKGATMIPGNMALGAIYTADPGVGEKLAFQQGQMIGRELQSWGATWTLAPVIDVNSNPKNPVIGIRSIGEDPNTVAKVAVAQIKGLQSVGVAATVKHVPDHGDTAFDTHTELPVDLRPRDQIRGIIPLKEAIKAGVAAIMPSHVAYPNAFLEPKAPKIKVTIPDPKDPSKTVDMEVTPATVSPAILTDFFRKELGFQGVIITDALEMGAIIDNFGIGYAALLALEAGADAFISGTDPVFLDKVWQEKFGRPYTIEDQLEAHRVITRAAKEGIVTVMEKQKDGKLVRKEIKISQERQQVIRRRIDESVRRILQFQSQWGLTTPPDSDVAGRTVGSVQHRLLSEQLNESAVTLLKAASRKSLKGLPEQNKVVVIRPQFERLTPADSSYKIGFTLDRFIRQQHRNTTGLAVLKPLPEKETLQERENRENAEKALVGEKRPGVEAVRGVEEAVAQVKDADVIVVETYFGHQSAFQRQLLAELAKTDKRLVHLVMGNPYDAGIVWDKADIVAVGYSPHAARAMAKLLFEEIKPQGKLPVSIPGVAERGVGLGSFAGLEEIQSVFNRLMGDQKVQQGLLKKGWVSLEPEQAGAFGYKAAGGFVIADTAKVTDGNHAVIADEDLANEAARRLLTWIEAGKTTSEVVRNARLFNVRRGDLLLLEAEPGMTVDQVKRLLVDNEIEGAEAVRAVIGDNAQVKNLSVFAFQFLASQDGLPPVVVLSVAVRLQDESGREYTLILMA